MLVARVWGAALCVAVALLALACTSGDDGSADVDESDTTGATEPTRTDPPPPAGLQVAVVLPDEGSVDRIAVEQIAADVRRVGAVTGPEIASVRPFAPGAREFVPDIAWRLVERGTDLTCVLGRGSRSLTTELAELNPHRSFCAASISGSAEVPEGVHAVEIRAEELGHVVGLAAAAATNGGTIGLVLGADAMPRGSFRDGVVAGAAGREVVSVAVDEETDALAAVEKVLDAGAEVVIIDGVRDARSAVELAAEHARVLAQDGLVRGDALDETVLTWRLHWDVVLTPVLARLVEGGPGRHSVGFAEGTFTVTLGEAATAGVTAHVLRAITGFEERERDALTPATELLGPEGTGSPRPAPPDEEGDDSDDGTEPEAEEPDTPDSADEEEDGAGTDEGDRGGG